MIPAGPIAVAECFSSPTKVASRRFALSQRRICFIPGCIFHSSKKFFAFHRDLSLPLRAHDDGWTLWLLRSLPRERYRNYRWTPEIHGHFLSLFSLALFLRRLLIACSRAADLGVEVWEIVLFVNILDQVFSLKVAYDLVTTQRIHYRHVCL